MKFVLNSEVSGQKGTVSLSKYNFKNNSCVSKEFGLFPNFFILGAAKCGTTSLFQYLKEHPGIFMSPVKEPCFFCEEFQVVKNPVAYARLFEGAGNASWIGEASHVYFSSPTSARTLRTFVPEAKFVLILRHPSERAYSLYHHMRRYGYETIGTFEKALASEEKRVVSDTFRTHCNQYIYNFFYFRSGLFGEQIERYFALFERSQFHIVTLDQLMKSPLSTIHGIYNFLNVQDDFMPEIKVFNKGETSRFPLVQNFVNLKLRRPSWLRRIGMNWSRKYNLKLIPPINPETRHQLCKRFQSDLERLYDLTGITFPEEP